MVVVSKEEILPSWGLAVAGAAGAVAANALVYPLDMWVASIVKPAQRGQSLTNVTVSRRVCKYRSKERRGLSQQWMDITTNRQCTP